MIIHLIISNKATITYRPQMVSRSTGSWLANPDTVLRYLSTVFKYSKEKFTVLSEEILRIGESLTKRVSIPWSVYPWDITTQNLSPDEVLLTRNYDLVEEHPDYETSVEYAVRDELEGASGYVIRTPLRVKRCTPVIPKNSKKEDKFKYWKVQNIIEAVETIYKDNLITVVNWVWQTDTNNPQAIIKKVVISRGESLGTPIDLNNIGSVGGPTYTSNTLRLNIGRAIGLRCLSNLIEIIENNGRGLNTSVSNLSLLTGPELIITRQAVVGSIQLRFYGEWFSESVDWVRAEDAAAAVAHGDSTPLKARVYPPGINVADYYDDANHLEIIDGEFYYRMNRTGEPVPNWALRSKQEVNIL